MLTEQQLRVIESGGIRPVPAETLRQLCAAARVANAAARVEREERDAARRHPSSCNENARGLADRARADLARALRLYTAPRPAEVTS